MGRAGPVSSSGPLSKAVVPRHALQGNCLQALLWPPRDTCCTTSAHSRFTCCTPHVTCCTPHVTSSAHSRFTCCTPHVTSSAHSRYIQRPLMLHAAPHTLHPAPTHVTCCTPHVTSSAHSRFTCCTPHPRPCMAELRICIRRAQQMMQPASVTCLHPPHAPASTSHACIRHAPVRRRGGRRWTTSHVACLGPQWLASAAAALARGCQ